MDFEKDYSIPIELLLLWRLCLMGIRLSNHDLTSPRLSCKKYTDYIGLIPLKRSHEFRNCIHYERRIFKFHKFILGRSPSYIFTPILCACHQNVHMSEFQNHLQIKFDLHISFCQSQIKKMPSTVCMNNNLYLTVLN